MADKQEIPRSTKVPYYRKPADLNVDEWQTALRRQFAENQEFEIRNRGDHPVFSDFTVFNPESGNTYKVCIRDNEHSHHFCSCPDFRTNGLGTCKHIENVILTLQKNKKNWTYFNQTHPQAYSSLSLYYGHERRLRLKIGGENGGAVKEVLKPVIDRKGFVKPEKLAELEPLIEKVVALDPDFRVYPDVYEFIQGHQKQRQRRQLAQTLFPQGIQSPVFDDLIRTQLYPYQKEAVIKTFTAGRVLVADEMGLGKTVQALAAVELFARYLNVRQVLIVCPTSLKYQWQKEIEKFTGRSSLVVEGLVHKRKSLYQEPEFYKIISYGITRNDQELIKHMSPDLVIIDEAQRIKNWQTKTAKAVKQIQSSYALVLTGTPLENRLQELHSIVEFIDMYKLGPLFRFLDTHQTTDAFGKIIGYKKLKSINKTLKPILIRRTKTEIIDQLPGRIDKNLFVDMTNEQKSDHDNYYEVVCRLVTKWRNQGFLREKEREYLLINLSCMRMVADSTYILNQDVRNDVKIDELMFLLTEILETPQNKVVIFSEWKKMFELVILELEKRGIEYVYLHGGLSPRQRRHIISRYHQEPNRKDIFVH
ncbi:MAG: DEAD/DEAH box helicase [candidate division KSB1 bacterium]|nr:DEAD/DEAH box helicase [candidate division KSB1 bacterium]